VRKPKRTARPDPLFNTKIDELDDFMQNVTAKPKPAAGKFNTKPKPSSDRNRDRHSPGYMREYMRDYMRRRRAKQKRK